MLKTIGAALAMAFAWGFAGIFLGFGMEGVDPHGEIADIWPAVIGYPAFFAGLTFFILLRVGQGTRKLEDISITRAAALGAIAGLLLPSLFVVVVPAIGGNVTEEVPSDAWPAISASIAGLAGGAALLGAVTVPVLRRIRDSF